MARSDIVARVVDAVATADGLDVSDLDPLYEYVDPEVLGRLDAHEGSEWRITFRYSDHQVTVAHDGRVLVDGVVHSPDAPME